jgi:hypothetical protein
LRARPLFVLVLAACAPPPPAATEELLLLEGQQRIYPDGDRILVIGPRGQILSVPKTGTTATVVRGPLGPIDDFIIDGDHVYFTQSFTGTGFTDLQHMKRVGGAVDLLWPNVQRGSLRSFGSDLYFFDRGSESAVLTRLSKSGGGSAQIYAFPAALPSEMVIDATHIYLLPNEVGLARLPRSGGTLTTFLPGVTPAKLSDQGGVLYYMERPSGGKTGLYATNKSDGRPRALVDRDVTGYALTPDFAVFTTLTETPTSARQSISRIGLDGSGRQTLIRDLGTITLLSPAADADAAYWSDGSTLKRFSFNGSARQ